MADNSIPSTLSNTGLKKLEDWKQAIRLGIRYRMLYGRSKKWQTYKNYYRGHFVEGTVPVNIIYAIGRSIIPQIYFRNLRVNITARRPGYWPNALVLERVDNVLLEEMGLKQTFKSMILDSYLCGNSMGILGYDSEYGFNPSFASEQGYQDGTLSQFSEKGEKIEYNYNISPGMPWFQRCNPLDFIVPWGTHKWEEAPWFAFRKMRPLRDIKEDPKYTNKNDLKAVYKTRLEGSDNESIRTTTEDFKTEFVELWEVHDQRSGQVFALSLDHDKFLRDEIDEMQVEGLPARTLSFNEDPDYFWCTPDCRLIEQQQLEINDIRTMAKLHRRVALLKVLYDKNMLKPEELEKLLDGNPKVGVAVDTGINGDIRRAVALFQSHVPPDLSMAAAEVREDVREIIGFSRNQMGAYESPGGRRSATEANIVRAASMIRIDERRDAMADLFSSVMRATNQCIFKNWNDQRIVDFIGPDGARYWVRFTGREIKGEFAYKVNPEEAMPANQGTRRQDFIEIMNVASKIPNIDIGYVVQQYANNFDWLDNRMLLKNLSPGQGAGRSPEKAVGMQDIGRVLGAPLAGDNQFTADLQNASA